MLLLAFFSRLYVSGLNGLRQFPLLPTVMRRAMRHSVALPLSLQQQSVDRTVQKPQLAFAHKQTHTHLSLQTEKEQNQLNSILHFRSLSYAIRIGTKLVEFFVWSHIQTVCVRDFKAEIVISNCAAFACAGAVVVVTNSNPISLKFQSSEKHIEISGDSKFAIVQLWILVFSSSSLVARRWYLLSFGFDLNKKSFEPPKISILKTSKSNRKSESAVQISLKVAIFKCQWCKKHIDFDKDEKTDSDTKIRTTILAKSSIVV